MNKITYTASEEGVEIAERALIRLGFGSKSNFAKSQLMSRTTVTRFFQRVSVQLDSFKRICKGLKLNWEEIAKLPEKEQLQPSSNMDSDKLAIEQFLGTSSRQVTVIDKENNTVKAVITLEGDINSVSNFKILELILREHSGDTITIKDAEEGSIKLIVEGSPEDIQKLVERIQSKELTEVNGFPVEDIQRLAKQIQSEEALETNISNELIRLTKRLYEETVLYEVLESTQKSENSTKPENKWDLVQEIVSQGARGRSLSGVNLSDADLSGSNFFRANLSDAYLNGTDLGSAKLNYANLSRANLGNANLTSADLFGANLINASLEDADLSNANLNYANLVGTSLIDANLNNAKLRHADLSDTDLWSVNLNGADVQNTRFNHAKGISEELKNDLIQRGAIFEDSPSKDSSINSPTPFRP